jgi:hypothetical protein
MMYSDMISSENLPGGMKSYCCKAKATMSAEGTHCSACGKSCDLIPFVSSFVKTEWSSRSADGDRKTEDTWFGGSVIKFIKKRLSK